MNSSFENKVALVTGAASGMGLATAQAFAEAGAATVLADFREEAVKAEAKKLVAAGHKAIAIRCDVSDDAQVEQMVIFIVSEFGRLDADDNKLTETNGLGKTTTYTYDTLDNRLTETDALGHKTSYVYNQFQQVLTITDPLNHTTTNTYDGNGNLLTTTDPLSNVTTNTYSSSGLLVTSKDALNHTTSFAYDGSSNLLSQTDAAGTVTNYTYDSNGNRLTQAVTRTTPGGPQTLTTTYTYDANNRLVKTTLPDGAASQVVYNTIGQQAATIDARGNQTSYLYDADGRVFQTNYADGNTDKSQFDLEGHRTQANNRGIITNYVYDKDGRLSQTIAAFDSATTTTSYDAAGQVISTTDPLSHVTQYAYDDAGRRSTVTDAAGKVTTFAYDNAGNQTSVKDANQNTTTYTYDNANRRTQVTYPDGKFETTTYDALGRVASRTDASGKVTQYGYDALGRLTSVVQDAVSGGLNLLTQYSYDEVGNRLTQTDANTHTTSYAYDQRGRRTQRKLPLGQTESYTYDANGNLATRTDFNGHVTTYGYDNMNRLLSKGADPYFVQNNLGAAGVSYTYTATGKRASMNDASGTTTYRYDGRDRLTIKNAGPWSVGYDQYDLASNLTQLTTRALGPGFAAYYGYDAVNRLTAVFRGNLNVQTTLSYDAVGNLQAVNYPNGVVHSYTYDTRNRLTNLGVTSGASNIASYAYTLDAAGHRTSVAEKSGRTVNYSYDSIYRLTNETIASDPNGVNGAASYTYDPVGNRTQKVSTIPGYPGGPTNYNANDQLSADAYDANGNTTTSSGTGYVYDFENHLIQAGGGISYVYDGDGNRKSKTVAGVTTTYVVADQNPTGYAQVLEEDDSTGAVRQYTYGLDLLSRLDAATGKSIYYVKDGHGSVRALTDQTGAVTDTYDYDAFGNLIHSLFTGAAPTPNNYLFAGEQFDSDLNLYYNRARYLNVSTGRFWTIDTLDGNFESPQSLHKYLYAENDSIDFTDPSGHSLAAAYYGQQVHDAIGADFEFRVPLGIYNNSVKSILGIRAPGLRLRPDLTDPINHLGYEIKPVGSAALGAAQLAGYLFALTLFDPGRNVWLPGELYIPLTWFIINTHAVALVSPPIAGVIIYEVIDEVEITGIVAAATAALGADLYGSFAVATLTTATAGAQ